MWPTHLDTQYWLAAIILSFCLRSQRPLLRALANSWSYAPAWTRGDICADRGVRKQSFSTSLNHLWWPEQKYEEVAANDVSQQQAGTEGDNWISAFDSPIHGGPRSSKRHEVPRRIHILGVGNVGLFIAHSLAGIPNRPPITLLSHKEGSLRSWQEAGECIEVVTDGSSESRHGFDLEYVPPLTPASSEGGDDEAASFETLQDPSQELHMPDADGDPTPQTSAENETYATRPTMAQGDDGTIWNLIVSVKASVTIQAVSKVAHRLCRDSSILFLQNGMGMLDELNGKLFPDVEARPNYVVGVISHGIHRLKPYTVNHAGFGSIAVGILPRRPAESFHLPTSARYLVRTITRTPILAAVPFPPTDLLEQQLDKLAVNCIINPLTAVFDCTNGDLLDHYNVKRIMRLLLAEISLVIRSLPELEGVPNKSLRYDPKRLETMVVVVARRTSKNVSSMLHDVRFHSKTEIDYINGYIIRRGEEMGIKCVLNYMLLQMVKVRAQMVQKEEGDKLPLGLQDSLMAHTEVTKSLSPL